MRVTERFSDRVSDYVKYRPGYPEAAYGAIERRFSKCSELAVAPLSRIAADVGSGTGIFTRGLLARGFEVHAIEPNREMRAEAERALGETPGFVSHGTLAEATGLRDQSVALVAAAQAFHWFDAAACHLEWKRILVPGGLVCLIWNVRQLGSPFMDAYETALSTLVPEYSSVMLRHEDAAAWDSFFGGPPEIETYPHQQSFDWKSFQGRVASSSYAPKPGEPLHQPLMSALREVFERHQRQGQVCFRYQTRVVFGQLH